MHSRTGIKISIIPAALLIYAVLVLCPFSRAYANYQDVESYSYDFLVETANAADVTPNELVVNYVFQANIVTGQNLTDEQGMSLEDDVEENLSHMRETEDYPNWENLPEEWKTRWGTPKDYYSSKFNHLYSAGSGGRGYDTDMTQFEGSGGNDFSWTDDVHDKLVALGRSVKKFLLGDANSVADVLSNFLQGGKENIETYMQVQNYTLFDGGNLANWPSALPNKIPIAFTNMVVGTAGNNYGTFTNVPTYKVAVKYNNNFYLISFLETAYYIKNGAAPANDSEITTAVRSYTSGSHTYYMASYTSFASDVSIPYVTVTSWSTNDAQNMAICVLFGGENVQFPTNTPIIDYPETINTTTNVYFPGSINPNSSWTDYTTPNSGGNGEIDLSELLTILGRIETKLGLLDTTSEDLTTLETAIAQFKFYTGGILKVHDEGIFDSLTDIGSDIHDILTTLELWPKGDAPDAPDIIGDFDFDELQGKSDLLLESVSDLAPFGALLLMSEMVGILSQTGNLEEPEFVVPFQFMPGHSYDVTIDLSWLEDGRVYINFFCILSLILCLLNITVRIIELEAAS